MKIIVLLCILSFMFVLTSTSPLQLIQRQIRGSAQPGALAAGSGAIAPGLGVATGANEDDDEDDDDDDDDDDSDLADLVDDDDDDEDEDDDNEEEDVVPQGLQAPGLPISDDDEDDEDDDDDYLDRLFDDILGDDEEEDDDDVNIRPVINSVTSISANAPEEIAPASAQPSSIVSVISDGVERPEDAAILSAGSSGNTVQNDVQVLAATSNAVTTNVVNPEGNLADDEDDEEADDEDDDDIIGDDVIEARRETRESKLPTSMQIFIAKKSSTAFKRFLN